MGNLLGFSSPLGRPLSKPAPSPCYKLSECDVGTPILALFPLSTLPIQDLWLSGYLLTEHTEERAPQCFNSGVSPFLESFTC